MFRAGLTSLGVTSGYSPATSNSRGMAELYTEGIVNVLTILLPLLYQHQHFMYWKFHRFELLRRLALIIHSGLHNTHIGIIAALNLIYSYPSDRDYTLEHWIQLANAYYAQYDASLVSGHANIAP